MGAKMRLTKTAREKLMKEAELYEQTCCFIINFDEPTEVLDYAYKNIYGVYHDLDVILSSSSSLSSCPLVDDVSSMILKNRSTIENELVYICDKSYPIEIQQAFKDFLVHFKQGDLTKYGTMVATTTRYNDIIGLSKWGNKQKAPQLTKQQQDARDKHLFYLEELYSESQLYELTHWFMISFLNDEQVTTKEQRKLLVSAYQNILLVHSDFGQYIESHEDFSDKDVPLILSQYRSKVQNELQGICDNVSNLIVQEAFSRYLDDFKTGLKLTPQDHLSHFQNEDGKITSTKPKTSVKKKKKKSKLRLRGKGGSRSCKTPSLFDLDKNDYFPVRRVNHSKCCMNKDLETSDSEWEDTWAKEYPIQPEVLHQFDDDCF